jgi:aspartate racemase
MHTVEPNTMHMQTDAPFSPAPEVVGVLGGMGPVASAEFLKTIYEGVQADTEQGDPVVLLFSDPTFPDRTTAFLAGDEEPVLEQLVETLERMVRAGATRLVMCCMTVHHLVPQLPWPLRERVVSLFDVVFDELAERPGRYLMLCSSGSRALRLYERHPRWAEVADRVVMPSAEDQEAVHREMIYAVKRGADPDAIARRVDGLLERYGADGFIAGCSEVHVMAKRYFTTVDPDGRRACVDPLATVAAHIRRGSLAATAGRAA